MVGLLLAGIYFFVPSVQASEANTRGQEKTVLIVGDSLSAEYGLTRGTGWVDLMAQQAKKESIDVKWVNASISGDTTSGGVTRLPSLLKLHQPSLVVIELGGNDALRGLDMGMTQANLMSMVKASQTAGAKVLVIAMQVPPNYGYEKRQKELAKKRKKEDKLKAKAERKSDSPDDISSDDGPNTDSESDAGTTATATEPTQPMP